MRLTPFAPFVIAVALGAAIWVAMPVITGRPLRLWEALVVSAAVFAVLELWRARRLRRERKRAESLRDSALW